MEQLLRDPDHELVEAARGGSFDAFDELVTRHENRVYSIAMGILRRRDEAEDAAQTTFLNALEHLDGFRGDASFRTWVSRIATNTALKALRKRKGLPSFSLDAAVDDDDNAIPHPELVADWSDNPAENVERSELRRILEAAVEELSEKHRIVFLLRDVNGLSVRETAEAVGISESNVKVRLLRARLALREILTRAFAGDAEPPAANAGNGTFSTPVDEILRDYEAEGGEDR